MNNSPCETEAQGTTPSSYMHLIHNFTAVPAHKGP